ncbi:hypothetical protein PORCRE_770 [Porphyromonas crevioricanis JCM 15906]|uniref:Uncharacterized protein n=1 Tax=Porphyromonas crevioricanis JCM 15906 TaxID=1305617 RepID=T1CMS7_9PORP|nr:hypothetical protein PORCRE_770 [Porphyromonas crevioricanis JCM 15906]GAD08119.1 hypothetical protein PORCAN_1754 [Porphyromonas crevioricanis JCM 13913]
MEQDSFREINAQKYALLSMFGEGAFVPPKIVTVLDPWV